jgi:hypothetical protein
MKVSELFESQVDEGAWDYIKGVGQHFGNNAAQEISARGEKILKPFRDAHQFGKNASARADVQRNLKRGAPERARQAAEARANTPEGKREQFIGQFKQVLSQLGPIVQQIKALKAQQPRNRQTNEGMWDYMRGAGKAMGQSGNAALQSAQRSGKAMGQRAQQAGSAVLRGAQAVPGAIQRGAQVASNSVQGWHEEGKQTNIETQISTLRKNKYNPLINQLAQMTVALGPTGIDQMVRNINKYFKNQENGRSTAMIINSRLQSVLKTLQPQSPQPKQSAPQVQQQVPTQQAQKRPPRGSLPAEHQQGRINPSFA